MKCAWQIDGYEVHTFAFPVIDARMYCIRVGKTALIVDPCISIEALKFLDGVEQANVLLTHEHIDHISGVNILREHIKDCKVICSSKCAERITDSRKNLAKYQDAMFCVRDKAEQEMVRELNLYDYTCHADKTFDGDYQFRWNNLTIKCIEMPGHSKGSIGIFINDKYFFSGDSLLNGVPVTTVLPGGSKKDFANVTKPIIDGLPHGMIVFPGHGEAFEL